MRPFIPLFRNPHVSTIAGNFWRRSIDERKFPTRSVFYDTVPGTRVRVEENRPPGEVRGEVLLHHGLEGSSRSGYLVSLAHALAEAGYAAHRINMRSCGGTEHLTDTLYHSGLTGDVRAILERWRAEGRGPRYLVGFSLGGNVSLKLAGEMGEAARDLLSGVCAVSTPIDLHACVRRLSARENRLYEMRFVRSLKARYKVRHSGDPERYHLDGLESTRTVFEFDDRFTAQAFGFGSAANYYATQSALRFLPGIRVPTLLVQSADDPMIPFAIFESAALRENPCIRVLATEHGGHLGFLSRTGPRFWLDGVVTEWLNGFGTNRG